MSAFLVSDRTIHVIANALDGQFSCEHLDQLGKQLLWLNHQALTVRYGDEMPFESPEDVVYRYSPICPPPLAPTLKACRCWLYQCCEGDVTKHDLYQRVEELSVRLAMELVASIPEYQDADWC